MGWASSTIWQAAKRCVTTDWPDDNSDDTEYHVRGQFPSNFNTSYSHNMLLWKQPPVDSCNTVYEKAMAFNLNGMLQDVSRPRTQHFSNVQDALRASLHAMQ